MQKTYKVVDLFAGPGGLAEGLASVRLGRNHPFEIALSVEKDPSAHATLRLRSFVRRFGGRPPREYLRFLGGGVEQPDWSLLYPEEWKTAEEHALLLELGTKEAKRLLRPHLDRLADQETIVVGGPPCQAYSIVGRVRNRGTEGYDASQDHRHFLFREYIDILRRLKPAAFVMENVKGLLSSQVDGVRILDLVLRDLKSAGGEPGSYRLVALAPDEPDALQGHEPQEAADFLVKSENHGVPQNRHRMIIVGVRADHAGRLDSIPVGALMPRSSRPVSVGEALSGLPEVRSGLTRSDSFQAWRDAVIDSMDLAVRAIRTSDVEKVREIQEEATLLRDTFWMRCPVLPRAATGGRSMDPSAPQELVQWLTGMAAGRVANHETRPHMTADLARYFFAAVYASVHNWSPRAEEYPAELEPDHRNWASGHFRDRFRVQLAGTPATTITSHISKDGHYFIHPDPLQCRALTVREAARLQTFPDDYIFLGPRTAQYTQVGNAVPPFLARQIGEALLRILVGRAVDEDAEGVAARSGLQ